MKKPRQYYLTNSIGNKYEFPAFILGLNPYTLLIDTKKDDNSKWQEHKIIIPKGWLFIWHLKTR